MRRAIAAIALVAACSGGRIPGDGDGDGPADAAPDAEIEERVTPVINEFMRAPPLDPGSGEEAAEFVEVFGAPDTDYRGYSLLQVRGNGEPIELGTVRTVHDLGATNRGGFWSTGYQTDTFKNNTYTLLLVRGYTEGEDFDLDTDNDGAIDMEPWAELVDAIAYQDDGAAGPTDLMYADHILRPGADGDPTEWGGGSRIPDGVDSWVRNDPDGAGLPGFEAVTADLGEALSTLESQNRIAGVTP